MNSCLEYREKEGERERKREREREGGKGKEIIKKRPKPYS